MTNNLRPGTSLLRFRVSRCGSPRIILVGILIFVLGAGTFASAANPPTDKKNKKTYALIKGTVWGPDNLPVYGVHIKIRRANEKKVRWELYSDHNGEFAQRLPAEAADYVIFADLHGYKPMNGNALSAGEDAKVHIDFDELADVGVHLK